MFSASGAGYVVAGLMMNVTEQAPVGKKNSTCFNQDTSFLLAAAAGSLRGYVCASRSFFVASFITNTIFFPPKMTPMVPKS